jgi:N-acetylneuraminic acid mutarotase
MKKNRVAWLIFLVLSGSFFPLATAVEDSWVTLAPMLSPRSNHAVAVVDGRVYVLGGGNSTGFLNCTEEYSVEFNTWTTKAQIPSFRERMATAVYQNKIYVIGGQEHSGVTATNEVYDVALDIWETKSAMPTARTDLVANQVNGKIYVMAGKSFIINTSWPVLCNQTQIYDPETDTWTTGAEMPDFDGNGPLVANKSEDIASAVVDTKIYVIVSQTLHIYDAETDSWSYGADLPDDVSIPVACATTGTFAPKRLYVVSKSLHYAYDPETDQWSSETPIPNSRFDVGLTAVNDELYAIGGIVFDQEYFTPTNTNEKYTPSGYIPEFPTGVTAVLIIGLVALILVVYKTKINKTQAPTY